MKRFYYCFLIAVCSFVLAGCSVGDDYEDAAQIIVFWDEPAFVESVGDSIILRTASTPYGNKFSVSEKSVENNLLAENDLVWTYFRVVMDDAQYSTTLPDGKKYYRALDLSAQKIGNKAVIIPSGQKNFDAYMIDSYSADIDKAQLYTSTLDNLLCFEFSHTSSAVYDYEMVLDPSTMDAGAYPTFYIRAKRDETSTSASAAKNIFAFDMSKFVEQYNALHSTSAGAKIRFNLKYKVGTVDGNDIYRDFLSNPIEWQFN
ncbi:MAG: hypothetical protein LBR64_08530 [Dysgonamonadaceae bacterium]|jgi:predicted small secreted protein|nr:hypothetical protein [Dysgonamonadaceae bacterium]